MSHTTTITLMSFGFKHGAPESANVIMDVRFLQNPHWVKDLKSLDGRDQAIADYIKQDPKFDNFFENLTKLLTPLIDHHIEKQTKSVTIAIGCTGGHHRSVFVVETLREWFKSQGVQIHINHRDLKN